MKNATLSTILLLLFSSLVLSANEQIKLMPTVSTEQKAQAYLYADTPFLMNEELFYYDAQFLLKEKTSHAQMGAYFPLSLHQAIKVYSYSSDWFLGIDNEKGSDYLALEYRYNEPLHLPARLRNTLKLDKVVISLGGQYLYANRDNLYARFENNAPQNIYKHSYDDSKDFENLYKYNHHTVALLASLGVIKDKWHGFVDVALETRQYTISTSAYYLYKNHLRIGAQLLDHSIAPTLVLYPSLAYARKSGFVLEVGRYLNIPHTELEDSPLSFRLAWVK